MKLCKHAIVQLYTHRKTSNTTDAASKPAIATLHAVQTSCPPSPSGHYVAIINSQAQWLEFDDEEVDLVSEAHLADVFG